jgi:hypothetical protein
MRTLFLAFALTILFTAFAQAIDVSSDSYA